MSQVDAVGERVGERDYVVGVRVEDPQFLQPRDGARDRVKAVLGDAQRFDSQLTKYFRR